MEEQHLPTARSPDAGNKPGCSLSLRTILLSSDRCTLLTSLKHVNYSTD